MFIILLGLIALEVFSIWGLVYLTKFSFSKKDEKDQHCVTMNTFQRNLTRLTTILLWLSLGFSALIHVFMIFSGPVILKSW